MPRRKPTADEGGRRAQFSGLEHNETMVISDSDHEEEKDSPIKRSSRAARWRRRENESHLRDMTEEEMLEMAMKLSAQEANSAAQRQQLEDNNVQKAIVESLNDNSLKRSENLLEAASTSDQPQPNIENLKSYMRRKLCYPSQEQVKHDDETASPLPEMPDLSQETSSHLSSISSAPGRWPSAASWLVMSSSQESCSRKVISSPLQTPATTIRVPLVCVEKLSQNLTKEGKNSINLYSEDSDKPVFTSKSPSVQQESLSSLLLTQSDINRTLKTEESHTRVEDDKDNKNAEIPDDVNSMTQISQEALSPRSSGTDECISPSMKTQLSRAKSFENKAGMEENKTSFLTQVENDPLQEKCEGLSTETHSQTQSWSDFTSHMVLHLDDNDDDDSEGVVSPTLPSPQVPVSKSDQIKLLPTESCIYSTSSPFKTPPEGRPLSQSDLTEISRAASKPTASEPSPKVTESGESTVSYYWGVPFCPAGQNPDDYTRVILCQMEVYEKSLKKAQRELLCKAEWGEPICPSSSPKRLCPRRWKPHRTHCFSDDKEENKEEKESKGIEVEGSQNEAVQGSVADSQDEPYIILSSPDTKDELLDERPICSQQEHVRKSPDECFGETERGTQDALDDVTTPCPAEHEAEYEKAYEEEETVCPETQMTDSSTPELMMTSPAQSHADSERMDIEENAIAPAVEEEVMEQECGEAATTPSDESMECPICSKVFSLCQIEVHAADCNGESENLDIEELSPVLTRRTRIRRDVGDQAKHRSEVPAEMEKCYLCHGFFPPQDYPGHVNRCLKTIDSRPDQGNRLLSALDQTESRDSGREMPGPSDLHTNSGLPDPAVTATRERNVHTSATASSPTIAFSPLSENTHCLIDSEQQDAHKTSQRLSRKRKFKR